MRTLSDTGLAFRWHEARLYVRALQVVDVQLGSGIGQPRDVGIPPAATVPGLQAGGIGMSGGLAATAQELVEKDDATQKRPRVSQGLSGGIIAGGMPAASPRHNESIH